MKGLILVLSMLMTFPAFSQMSANLEETDAVKSAPSDSLFISCPSNIVNLHDQFVWYNKKKPGIEGYRIELYSSSGANSRAKATQIAAKLEKEFDHLKTYVVWEYPNFEVEIGDYRTSLEAERDLQTILKAYPQSFLKKSSINLPELNRVPITLKSKSEKK